MLFMDIGTWEPSATPEVIKRAVEKGRQIPEGYKVIGEWTDATGGRNFRLLETDDASSLVVGNIPWHDIIETEIVPVIEIESAIDTVRGA